MGSPEHGLMAEFETGEDMLAAVRTLREKGYERLDTFSPYPVHGTDEALGLRKSLVPWCVLAGGLCGGAAAYFLQWLLNAYLYPINVGGRPPHAAPAFIIITFEMTVLFAGLTAFTTVLLFNDLPRLHHPVFEVEGFERATIDRFWIIVGSDDAKYDVDRTRRDVEETKPLRVALPPTAAELEERY